MPAKFTSVRQRKSISQNATCKPVALGRAVTPGDRCLRPSVKVKYHWRKASWHETKMHMGLSKGIVAFAACHRLGNSLAHATTRLQSFCDLESIAGRVVKTLVSGIFLLLEKREKTLEKH